MGYKKQIYIPFAEKKTTRGKKTRRVNILTQLELIFRNQPIDFEVYTPGTLQNMTSFKDDILGH